MNAPITIRRTLMPAARLASLLPPIAYTCRPDLVYVRNMDPITAAPTNIQTGIGMPSGSALPKLVKLDGIRRSPRRW